MGRIFLALVAALFAVSFGGCGTVCNLVGGFIHPQTEPRVYGGVTRDLEVIDHVVTDMQSGKQGSGTGLSGTHERGAVFVAALLVSVTVGDPILSFVADTLTLPLTIPLQNRRIADRTEGQP
jgi:hypothetical protein